MTARPLPFLALLAAALAAPGAASQGEPAGDGAPLAPETARYCLRIAPVTGTNVEVVRCWTRAEWATQGVDIDREWAREGVRVIDG